MKKCQSWCGRERGGLGARAQVFDANALYDTVQTVMPLAL